ncbi:hypothetical protein ANCDUO_21027 [Ancylostoma duodenale]|uniref:Uncharacterized protein n=1 Tax=Ancylostoma duodenale TaxID=51022 RepID=A0A0C2FK07_9BILA|nr:hypothetical protein ANCDUO_21027 [Ancylostoma duodenale]
MFWLSQRPALADVAIAASDNDHLLTHSLSRPAEIKRDARCESYTRGWEVIETIIFDSERTLHLPDEEREDYRVAEREISDANATYEAVAIMFRVSKPDKPYSTRPAVERSSTDTSSSVVSSWAMNRLKSPASFHSDHGTILPCPAEFHWRCQTGAACPLPAIIEGGHLWRKRSDGAPAQQGSAVGPFDHYV